MERSAIKLQDPYNLQRFVDAQEPVYQQVLREMRTGRKTSHWMWFVFPQLKGLGRSSTAEWFGIDSLEEAEAYLRHSLLGPRLRECVELITRVKDRSAEQIVGHVDAMKLRSSLTLFAHATEDNALYLGALRRYYNGEEDPLTLERLWPSSDGPRGQLPRH